MYQDEWIPQNLPAENLVIQSLDDNIHDEIPADELEYDEYDVAAKREELLQRLAEILEVNFINHLQ